MIDSLRMAKVVGVHPQSNAVDLVFLDNGQAVPHVTVMSLGASSNTGLVDLPTPTESSDPSGVQLTFDRDVFAFCGFVRGLPVVLGFQFPEVCQMLFERADFRVQRHASDVYTTVDKDGNVELFHPSGTYLRIGEDPAHEDLTAQDFDKRWKIARNTDKAVHVKLSVANAGVEKARLQITPDGDVTLQNDRDLAATVGGDATIDVAGSMTTSASVWNHTGPVNVYGDVTFTGQVSANGKRIDETHKHTDVTAGGSQSGTVA